MTAGKPRVKPALGESTLATGSALTEGNLDAGMAAIEKQTENDVPLDTPARFLLVPPSERCNGRRLARNMALTDAGNLKVRSEPRQELGVTDPVDDTLYAGAWNDWYRTSGEGAPTIEFGDIEDNTPRATLWQLKEGRWGVGFAAKWRGGAKARRIMGYENTKPRQPWSVSNLQLRSHKGNPAVSVPPGFFIRRSAFDGLRERCLLGKFTSAVYSTD